MAHPVPQDPRQLRRRQPAALAPIKARPTWAGAPPHLVPQDLRQLRLRQPAKARAALLLAAAAAAAAAATRGRLRLVWRVLGLVVADLRRKDVVR